MHAESRLYEVMQVAKIMNTKVSVNVHEQKFHEGFEAKLQIQPTTNTNATVQKCGRATM